MKRALLLCFLSLGACTPTWLESGRYACVRGEANQCPGAWRCGLEEYCHQLGDTMTAWRCETNDDCEGGFVCGVSKSREFRECHNPAAPQDWPCELPADCVGGWTCGLTSGGDARQCHDPAAPRAWPCESSADCVGGWSCGLTSDGERHECHDPANPRSWTCASNEDCLGGWSCGLQSDGVRRECHDPANPRSWTCASNDDCLGGWGCGLQSDGVRRECHDPANPRAWTCAGDEDCLGGWRCGTETVCVDPSADALGQLTLAGLDGGAHLNSLGTKSPITRLSVSPWYSQGRGRDRGNLTWVQDGHLRAMSIDSAAGTTSAFDLGSDLPSMALAQGARGSYFDENTLTVRNDELERVVMTWADGGTTIITFADGGVLARDDFGDNLLPFSLLGHGTAAQDLTPTVFAVGQQPGDYFARIRGSYLFMYPLITLVELDFQYVPNNRINSITGQRHGQVLECMYLTDARGLWVSQRGGSQGLEDIDGWDFEVVSLPPFAHGSCAGTTGPRITSVAAIDDRYLAITAQAPGAPVQVAALDVSRAWIDRDGTAGEAFCTTLANRACDADDRIPVDLDFGPCAACPAGSTFAGLTTVSAAGQSPSLEVRCEEPGGAGAHFRISKSGTTTACQRTLLTGESSLFRSSAPLVGQPVPGVAGWSGPEGQLWFGPDTANIAAVSFDRAPTGVVRTGPGRDAYIVFTPELNGTPSPGLGLLSTRTAPLTATVQHAPSLVVSGGELLDLTGTTLSAARTIGFVGSASLSSPVTASVTRATSGARVAVLSEGRNVYAANVEAQLTSSGPAAGLLQRLTTAEPVASLAFPKDQAPSSALLTGYAIVGSNVVRLVAETLTRWRTEPVPLPPTLFPLATWFQGTRGRVGFHDGSVFSLPSRVRISRPLPDSLAVDYAQPCGQQLALAPNGLYRLETDAAGPIGQWVKLTLPAEVRDLDFTDGRIHGLGNEAFVFTRDGEAARLTFDSCPE